MVDRTTKGATALPGIKVSKSLLPRGASGMAIARIINVAMALHSQVILVKQLLIQIEDY